MIFILTKFGELHFNTHLQRERVTYCLVKVKFLKTKPRISQTGHANPKGGGANLMLRINNGYYFSHFPLKTEIEINWTEGVVSLAPPWIRQYHREQKVPGGFSPVFWKLKKGLKGLGTSSSSCYGIIASKE